MNTVTLDKSMTVNKYLETWFKLADGQRVVELPKRILLKNGLWYHQRATLVLSLIKKSMPGPVPYTLFRAQKSRMFATLFGSLFTFRLEGSVTPLAVERR